MSSGSGGSASIWSRPTTTAFNISNAAAADVDGNPAARARSSP
jgi:hypothetical protein